MPVSVSLPSRRPTSDHEPSRDKGVDLRSLKDGYVQHQQTYQDKRSRNWIVVGQVTIKVSLDAELTTRLAATLGKDKALAELLAPYATAALLEYVDRH